MQTTIVTLNDLITTSNYYNNGMVITIPLETGEVILPMVKGPLFYKFSHFKSEYFNITKKQSAAYILINSVSGMMYVGSTSNIYERIHQHKVSLVGNINDSKLLQESFNSVNKELFDLCMIYTNDREQAFDIEQYLIDLLMDQRKIFNQAKDARRLKIGLLIIVE